MTRRLPVLILFLVLAGLLAPAGFAKAGTVSYYGVQFDGSAYATAQGISASELSVVVLFKATNLTGEHSILDARKWGTDWGGWNLRVADGKLAFRVVYNSSGSYKEAFVDADVSPSRTYLATAVFSAGTADLYLNGALAGSVSVQNNRIAYTDPTLWIGEYRTNSSGYFEGTLYMILIYNRALSDSEIQTIYTDPLHPPTSGLMLFYAPDSVDPAQNKWIDKSGHGNDGSIVGATYVPLSIPRLYVYNKKTSQPVNLTKVSVNMLGEKYTTLLPGFLILPPNSTITLQVEANGYLPTALKVNTSSQSIVAWLEPLTVAKQLVQYNVTQTLHMGLGNNIIIGFIFLTVLLIAGLKAGLGAGAILVIFFPLVLAMGFYGYLPMPVAFVATAIVGFGAFYVIRAAIGGDYR